MIISRIFFLLLLPVIDCWLGESWIYLLDGRWNSQSSRREDRFRTGRNRPSWPAKSGRSYSKIWRSNWASSRTSWIDFRHSFGARWQLFIANKIVPIKMLSMDIYSLQIWVLDEFVHIFEPDVGVLVMKIAAHCQHNRIGGVRVGLFLAIIQELGDLEEAKCWFNRISIPTKWVIIHLPFFLHCNPWSLDRL